MGANDMFKETFRNDLQPGDSISVEIAGVTYTARIEYDNETRPDDFDCYDETDIARWQQDDWRFCGLVISAECEGWSKDHVLSLWGIELGFSDSGDKYWNEVANECLHEALAHFMPQWLPATTNNNPARQ